MKIEVFEISTKEDKIYIELKEQYKSNPEIKILLDEFIFDHGAILAGDFRLIKMIDFAINTSAIIVYLVKDTDNNKFVWVIGKHLSDGKLSMYPLLKEQSEELQLEIKRVLFEKGIFDENKN